MAAMEWWNGVRRDVGAVLGSPRRILVPKQEQLTTFPPQVLPTAVLNPSESTSPLGDSLVIATTTTTTSSSAIQTSTPAMTSLTRETATAEVSPENDGGMSTAAKAGIVIGALGGLLVLFVLVWLIVSSRRKRVARRRQQLEDDEKIHGPFADSAAIRSTPNTAPRLSLRPVTQFLPTFTTQTQAERRASRGIALTLNPVSSPSPTHTLAPLQKGGSAWERPTLNRAGDRPGTSASLHPDNPFNDQKRLPDEPVSPISSMGSFDLHVGVATSTDPVSEPVSPIGGDDDDRSEIGVAHGGPSPSSLTRKTSIRKDLPKPLDLTKPPSPLYAMPPSPSGTEYSMHSMAPGQSPGPSSSAAAIAAAGGPSQSTVHRVQLDFKPTLEDELELRAGQLVRLLHEYDDGWALCIRLDRSQQGVVPRTCLSTRPVKPRPPQQEAGPGGPRGNQRGGPPINPSYHQHHNQPNQNQRQGQGQGQGGRPRSPNGGFGDSRGYETGYNDFQYQQRYGTPSPRPGQGGGGGLGGGQGGQGLSPAPGQAY